MTRRAAIERIVAMRYDSGDTWDLSMKDQEALRHAVEAFSDVDVLRGELKRARSKALKDAEHAIMNGPIIRGTASARTLNEVLVAVRALAEKDQEST